MIRVGATRRPLGLIGCAITVNPLLNKTAFYAFHLIKTGILIMLISNCQPPASVTPTNPVVAMIDEDFITLDDFRKAIRMDHRNIPQDETGDIKTVKKALLDQLIDEHLLFRESKRQGLTVDPQVLEGFLLEMKGGYSDEEFNTALKDKQISLGEWKEQGRKRLLIRILLDEMAEQKNEPTEQEIETYFKTHLSDFTQKEMVRSRQIVVSTREKALNIRGLILQGHDFSQMATTHSLSPDRMEGGDLGFFAKGELPEEFDVVFNLENGEISPVIESGYGFHLFRVEERQPEQMMKRAEADEKIKTILTQQKWKQRFSEFMTTLREKSKININYAILLTSESPSLAEYEGPDR